MIRAEAIAVHAMDGNREGIIDRAADEVLAFWFGAPDSPERGRYRKAWFTKDLVFDQACRDRFHAVHTQAAADGPEAWQRTPRRCLAYVILMDQMSRNMFRDSPQAFAFDAQALAMAHHAVEAGFERALGPLERMFLYLPFEHSENLADQRRSLELFSELRELSEPADVMRSAQAHYDVIARFGRFPHRNRILGRSSTAEELEYLSKPGAGW